MRRWRSPPESLRWPTARFASDTTSVDKGLEPQLTVLERIEMERIEARLDAEERDPQIEARDRQWETERTELLQSIEDLLLKLRR